MFEATFQADSVLVRVDVLSPEVDGRRRLVEVKGSTRVKDYQVRDCAIQAYVVERAGQPLSSVSVAHIDSSFVYPGGGDYSGLLKEADVTEAARDMAPQVTDWIDGAQATLSRPLPDIRTGPQCTTPFECPFIEHCRAEEGYPDYPVSILRSAGLVEALRADGYEDIRDVPAARAETMTGRDRWIHRVTVSGKSELTAAAVDHVRRLPYPRYYFDVEAIQFAVPIWAGTRPYQQLPFQWSCHVEHADGTLAHREFLDLSGEPPMRGFAESLIEALGDVGPIVVYSPFERRVLNELAAMFPDLARPLQFIHDRLEDFLPLLRAGYYHRDMRGSWSIKAVLPTISSDPGYDRLDGVADGTAAQQAYLEAIAADTPAERKAALDEQLRAYCRLDTRALLDVARFVSRGVVE